MKKLIPILFVVCLACSTNQPDTPAITTAGELIPDSSKLAHEKAAYKAKSDSILRDAGQQVRLGHIKMLKGLIAAFNVQNNFADLKVEDVLRLYKEGAVKPDLYVLKAGFKYDEGHQLKLIVKFINLTDQPIRAVEINNIITASRSQPVADYLSTNKLSAPTAIQPLTVKSAVFSLDNQSIVKDMLPLEGKSAIVYGIGYQTLSGKHFSSSKNVSTNLKWEYK